MVAFDLVLELVANNRPDGRRCDDGVFLEISARSKCPLRGGGVNLTLVLTVVLDTLDRSD